MTGAIDAVLHWPLDAQAHRSRLAALAAERGSREQKRSPMYGAYRDHKIFAVFFSLFLLLSLSHDR
jgi:hypothetical protein